MSSLRYPKQSYFMLFQLDEAGKCTWATCIKNILFSYGFGHVWILQYVGDENQFMKIFGQRIKNCFTQKWHGFVDESSKTLHYKFFKSLLTPETYLNVDISYSHKRILSDFRCSSHSLMIERGRHLSIDRKYRFCPICEKNSIYVIEDEYHFFFECRVYEELRRIYFTER